MGAVLSGHSMPWAGTLPSRRQAGSMVLVMGLAGPATHEGPPGRLAGGALVARAGGGRRAAAMDGGGLRAGGQVGTCSGSSRAMAESGDRQKPMKPSPLLATRKE
jgi:hypothetical protein